MKLRFLHRAWKARYRDQRQEISAALASIKPGDVVLDVGANKGAYLYWLRRAVGRDGKVYAFEPQPTLAEYLKKITAAMRWNNVIVRECALAEVSGRQRLYVPGQGPSPGASLNPISSDREPSQAYECEVETLDRELERERRISFLKVDVEGYELQLFRGSQKVLSRDGPALLFECEARHLRTHRMTDVFTFLQDLRYEGSFFTPSGLRPLAEFDEKVHQRAGPGSFWDASGYYNNFFFKPAAR